MTIAFARSGCVIIDSAYLGCRRSASREYIVVWSRDKSRNLQKVTLLWEILEGQSQFVTVDSNGQE